MTSPTRVWGKGLGLCRLCSADDSLVTSPYVPVTCVLRLLLCPHILCSCCSRPSSAIHLLLSSLVSLLWTAPLNIFCTFNLPSHFWWFFCLELAVVAVKWHQQQTEEWYMYSCQNSCVIACLDCQCRSFCPTCFQKWVFYFIF